jgi:hypothetical protein
VRSALDVLPSLPLEQAHARSQDQRGNAEQSDGQVSSNGRKPQVDAS